MWNLLAKPIDSEALREQYKAKNHVGGWHTIQRAYSDRSHDEKIPYRMRQSKETEVEGRW